MRGKLGSRIFITVAISSLLCLETVYAFRSIFTHTAISVLHTASTTTVAANNSRNYVYLQNDHATQKVWCKVGATAVVSEGFRVNAAGGTVVFDSAIPVAVINCIAETGTTIILVTEGRQ